MMFQGNSILSKCETGLGDHAAAHGLWLRRKLVWTGVFDGVPLSWEQLAVPGRHNAENALCAVLSVWAIRGWR